VAPEAVQQAEALLKSPGVEKKYPATAQGRGDATVFLADFFKNDFFSQTGGRADFDVIYDYTFLVALPPSMRPAWSKRMSELLAPGGHLICLEFPLFKEPKIGGPPHGVTKELFDELLSRPGEEVAYDEHGYVKTSSEGGRSNALAPVDRWKAERTHPAGAGKDHISVWRR
jgi:methyl halide transferase